MEVNAPITITLPRQVVIDLGHKIAELEELLETIEVLSNRELMAGIKRGETDIKEGRLKRVRGVSELDSLW